MLSLELRHEYYDKRKYECKKHCTYDYPGNHFFSYILSACAAHLFPSFKAASIIVIIIFRGRFIRLEIAAVTDR